jgi:hypothetical protein
MLAGVPRESVLLFFGLVMAGIWWRYGADRRHIRELQARATRDFLNIEFMSQDSRCALRGATALVERREETGGVRGLFAGTADFSVTIYARNEYGERFLFKWTSNSERAPFVKHLPGDFATLKRAGSKITVLRDEA